MPSGKQKPPTGGKKLVLRVKLQAKFAAAALVETGTQTN